MIVRDDHGIEWDCNELNDEVGEKDYRLFRCTRVNCPETPRYISFPLNLDFADPSILRQVLSRPRRRE